MRNVDESDFLFALRSDDDYLKPIRHLGNTDTPTVIVDFYNQTVILFREHDHSLSTMTIRDYINEDLKTNAFVQENYE